MSKYLILLCLALLTSCYRVPDTIQPEINWTVQDRYLLALPSIFEPLSPAEKSQDWGKEYLIGKTFARQLDLYRAITAFRRAEILDPPTPRNLEISYEILLCYYLGQRYQDLINTFTVSKLPTVPTSFPAYGDLLVILYDSYRQIDEEQKAAQVLDLIKEHNPTIYEGLKTYTLLKKGEYPLAFQKKSVAAAQWLNALIPGAGYLYIGQIQTAITALLVNGLFILAVIHSFRRRSYALAIILLSFEAGWYFGGIYGAGLEAKHYNERLYERSASELMNRNGLFPIFMLKYGP